MDQIQRGMVTNSKKEVEFGNDDLVEHEELWLLKLAKSCHDNKSGAT